jgi:hypothetical protein
MQSGELKQAVIVFTFFFFAGGAFTLRIARNLVLDQGLAGTAPFWQ